MASVTERVTILMEPEDKAVIERKAKNMGISVGELMRRGAAAYDPETDVEQISLLLQTLTDSHAETVRALDEAERELAETRAYFANKRRVAA